MRETTKIVLDTDAIIARQRGREIARQIGFSLVDQTRIAISISELARNILLYAGQGVIEIEKLEEQQSSGIKITAVDEGPGIASIEQVMVDGYSTSGGLGMGLPGTKRLMDEFEIQSTLGVGTRIQIIKWLNAKR